MTKNELVVLLAVLLASFAAGLGEACAGGAEQSVLNQFFIASRLRDMTALNTIATVVFEPRTNGTVTRFTVKTVSAERRKPVARSEMARNVQNRLVDLSVSVGRPQFDATQYDGEIASKEVTVQAPVRLPAGETAQQTLVVTIERVILNSEPKTVGRWIVTGVKN